MKRAAPALVIATLVLGGVLGPISRFARASGPAVARIGRAQTARAVTNLDDAQACQPLDDGRVAVATGGGLAIVAPDGGTRVLTAMDGLPGTSVHAVAVDGDAVWVGTESGAALVAPGAPKVVRVVPMASIAVRAILPTASGVYLGTWGSGVLRITPGSVSAEPVGGHVAGTRVAALALHEGSVYAAYADGPPARLENGGLQAIAGAPDHGQALASVARAGGASLYLGDLQGLFRLQAGSWRAVSTVDARAMVESEGRLWVGTFGSGLLVEGAGGAPGRVDGVPRFVRGVGAAGSPDELRCAASSEGVFVAKGGEGWRRLSLGRIPSNDVTAVAADGERVAIGTFDRGAALYDDGSFRPVAGVDPSESVEALAWRREGGAPTLWIGTPHGLLRTSADGSVRRWGARDGLPSSFVRAIHVLADGRVLAGTDAGPAFVDGDRVEPLVARGVGASAKGHAQPLDSPMRATWALAESVDGTLWIGTTAGLYYGLGGRFQRAAVSTGELADDWITSLATHAAGVFVGTYSGGVTHLRRAADGLHATQLGGGYVNPDGLSVVGGELVAATMDGALVRPVDDDGAAWRPRHDAAPGRDVTAVRRVGPTTWFASRRGIAIWTP
ncbi:MAG TPA: hypothetical protein VKU41_19705 [Polyangiaceae bacterium]|nr:hypothetical protein [Polyangiaceae bacterium]